MGFKFLPQKNKGIAAERVNFLERRWNKSFRLGENVNVLLLGTNMKKLRLLFLFNVITMSVAVSNDCTDSVKTPALVTINVKSRQVRCV